MWFGTSETVYALHRDIVLKESGVITGSFSLKGESNRLSHSLTPLESCQTLPSAFKMKTNLPQGEGLEQAFHRTENQKR